MRRTPQFRWRRAEIIFKKEIESAKDPRVALADKIEEFRVKFANPYAAAARGYIDDVIEPRNTRFRVIRALQSLATKKDVNPPKKHSNLPL